MGFLDKAKALANEAVDAGKRAADVVVEHVEEASKKDDKISKALSKSWNLTEKGIEVAQDNIELLSENSTGQSAGRVVRKAGAAVGTLPLVSAAIDSIKAKNCVDILLANLKTNPKSARANLWLAESLIKTAQDMTKYHRAKGIIDPSSFLIAGTIKKTAEFGSNKKAPHERLLIHAWTLATKDLKKNPRDSEALDILARIYLAKGDLPRAIRTSKIAILAAPSSATARVTLSRALLASGELASARRAGNSAFSAGSTVGLIIAAEATQLELRDENKVPLNERIKTYEDCVRGVTNEDRAKYNGAFRTTKEIAVATKNSQIEKTKQTWDKAKKWGGIIKNA